MTPEEALDFIRDDQGGQSDGARWRLKPGRFDYPEEDILSWGLVAPPRRGSNNRSPAWIPHANPRLGFPEYAVQLVRIES